jgi:hypothetical protein
MSFMDIIEQVRRDNMRDKVPAYKADPEDLAVELVKLEMEQEAIANKMKADRDREAKIELLAAKAEALQERRAKEAQEQAEMDAVNAHGWMVYNMMLERGMDDAGKIMAQINTFKEQKLSPNIILGMLKATAEPVEPKKQPPRPAGYGAWA